MCYIYARGYLCVLTQANSLGIFFRNGVLMMKKLLVTCFLFITMLSYSANIKLERIGIINLKKVVEVCFQGKSPAVKQLMEEKDKFQKDLDAIKIKIQAQQDLLENETDENKKKVAEKKVKELREQYEEEGYFEGINVYQSYFNDNLISLLDYFKDYIIVFDEFAEISANT